MTSHVGVKQRDAQALKRIVSDDGPRQCMTLVLASVSTRSPRYAHCGL